MVKARENNVDQLAPIIMVTGLTRLKYVVNARGVGMAKFIAKPLSAEKLLSKIVVVMDRRSRRLVKADGFFGSDRWRKEDNADREKRKNSQ